MLKHRSNEQEIMDDLTISGPVVEQTLRELDVINRLLGGNKISTSTFKRMCAGHTHLQFVDVGCGAGDVMMAMARWGRTKGHRVSFLGIDANENIVSYARQRTKQHENIAFKAINIMDADFQQKTFDIIHCCLFTHHFSDDELVPLFRQFREQARIGVIINDLHRHPLAFWGIKLLTFLFSRSPMVRNDAAISVSRGFKRKELEGILERAGIKEYDLSWRWAFRWKLVF